MCCCSDAKNQSPGLVIIGGDSCSEGRGYESQRCILKGHSIFSHIFVEGIVMFEKTKVNEKESGDGPYKNSQDCTKNEHGFGTIKRQCKSLFLNKYFYSFTVRVCSNYLDLYPRSFINLLFKAQFCFFGQILKQQIRKSNFKSNSGITECNSKSVNLKLILYKRVFRPV